MLTVFNDVLFSPVSLYFIGQQFIMYILVFKKAIRFTFIINTCVLVSKDVLVIITVDFSVKKIIAVVSS